MDTIHTILNISYQVLNIRNILFEKDNTKRLKGLKMLRKEEVVL